MIETQNLSSTGAMDSPNPYAADVMDTRNPYAAPTTTQQTQQQSQQPEAEPQLVLAGKGLRFANFVIDYFAQVGIGAVIGIVIFALQGQAGVDNLQNVPSLAIGIPVLLFYYFVCEATTSRTLGKLITGTKVVDENGNLPSIPQIMGRTFCRLIPFNHFSFLGSGPRGWHDSIPKTYVVKCR